MADEMIGEMVSANDEKSVDISRKQNYTLRGIDKHYDKYSVYFNNTWTDGKYYKYISVENFGSGSRGTLVRNAVTGAKYNIVSGSVDEEILFKVNDSRGRNKRKEPLMLYYDSPEQFENHHFTTVSADVKQKWLKQSLHAQKRYKR